jgi:hypothetical protein
MDNLHAQLEAAQSQAAAMAGLLEEAYAHRIYDQDTSAAFWPAWFTRTGAALAAWKGKQ